MHALIKSMNSDSIGPRRLPIGKSSWSKSDERREWNRDGGTVATWMQTAAAALPRTVESSPRLIPAATTMTKQADARRNINKSHSIRNSNGNSGGGYVSS